MFSIPRSLTLLGTLAAASFLVAGCATSGDSTTSAAADSAGSGVKLLSYRCEDGLQIKASYPTDSVALLRFNEQTHQLRVVPAASGVRYVGEIIEWWTKGNGAGSTALLSQPNADNATQTCDQVAV